MLPPVRSHESPALDLDDLITMPGCAKTMRAMTKLERPAIAIMPSPSDKEGVEVRGFGHQSTCAPLVEHGTDFQR
jgi:hypothetical protein